MLGSITKEEANDIIDKIKAAGGVAVMEWAGYFEILNQFLIALSVCRGLNTVGYSFKGTWF